MSEQRCHSQQKTCQYARGPFVITPKIQSTNSFHYKRLAIDLNLFDADGNYLEDTESHRKFGEFWESIGGTWGGRFKRKDGNHYSWGE